MHTDSNNKWNQFRVVIQKSLEDSLTPEEIVYLRESLWADAEARQYYINYMMVHRSLFLLSTELLPDKNDQNIDTINAILQDLSEYEKNAPAAEISCKEPVKELIQNIKKERVRYNVSRGSLYTIITSIAAILLIVLFVRFAPPKGGYRVATLADSIHAKWVNSDISIQNGFRFVTGKNMLLNEGLVELLFDSGVKVTFEAPAEFQLLTDDQINLRYGRLYAIVPQGAVGFTVNTQTSRVIDLGTEFGVEADVRGDVSLHVLKGQTTLIAGKRSNKVSISVSQGDAKKVSASTSNISDIPCNTELFAREIDSKCNFIWRGQATIDLADITSGGNGFGTGNPQAVIDPITGEIQLYIERGFGTRYATSSYSMTESLPYVDGVFIPDGGNGPIVISSTGTIFENCPDTSGAVRKDIAVLNRIYEKDGGELKLNDIAFGYPYRPAITIQANLGITFDLNAIRKDLEGFDLTYFETLCAVASDTNAIYETVDKDKRPTGKADFWILVDGQVKKTIQGVRMGFSETVRIPIYSNDRFLTILTTDHMESGELDPIGWDRCFLGEPVLGFESLD